MENSYHGDYNHASHYDAATLLHLLNEANARYYACAEQLRSAEERIRTLQRNNEHREQRRARPRQRDYPPPRNWRSNQPAYRPIPREPRSRPYAAEKATQEKNSSPKQEVVPDTSVGEEDQDLFD